MSNRPPFRAAPALALAAATTLLACGETPTTPDPDPQPTNQVPVAAAGPDQTVSVGLPVHLDGSASADADGGTLTFAWTIASAPTGSAATLDDPTSATPSFTPDVEGAYQLQLVVNDGTDDSAADPLAVTADDNTTTLTVAAAVGGSITSVDGLVTLDIPANALAADTEISMTKVTPDQWGEDASGFDPATLVIYDFKPDGLQFSAPATLTLTDEDGLEVTGDELATDVPFLINVDGTAASFLENFEGSAQRGSDDVSWTGELTHFSRILRGNIIGAGVRAGAAVPAFVPQHVPFQVRVLVVLELSELAPTMNLVDQSGPFIAPEPNLVPAFQVGPNGLEHTHEHDYSCIVPGGTADSGQYSSRVEITFGPPNAPITFSQQISHLLGSPFSHLGLVRFDAEVMCAEVPPPPPGAFVDAVVTGLVETITTTTTNALTTLLIARTGGITLLNELGSLLLDVEVPAVPASVSGPGGEGPRMQMSMDEIFGARGQIDAMGYGPAVAFGAQGVYVRQPMASTMDVVHAGRATDCWDQETTPGTFLYACAGFENKEIVFLESVGGAAATVDQSLTDLFSPGGVSVFGGDQPISVWFGPDGFTETSPLLVATMKDDGSRDGGLKIARLSSGQVTLEDVAHVDWPEPRQVRCSPNGMCAMSAMGPFPTGIGGLRTFTWDGTNAGFSGPGAFMAVGRVIGIDTHEVPGGNVLITSADFAGGFSGSNFQLRVEEWQPVNNTFSLTRSAHVTLPVECKKPVSAIIRPRVPAYDEALVSCQGEGATPGAVVSVMFTLQ